MQKIWNLLLLSNGIKIVYLLISVLRNVHKKDKNQLDDEEPKNVCTKNALMLTYELYR